jgi:hypothetical protein
MGVMKNLALNVTDKSQRDLERAMKKNPEKVVKALPKVCKKAMQPVLRGLRKRAPKKTGKIRKNLTTKQKKWKYLVWTGVGVKAKAAPHAWLYEHGHRIVVGGSTRRISGAKAGKMSKAKSPERTGKGRVVGFVPGRPFMVHEFKAQGITILTACREGMRAAVLSEMQK